MSILYNFKVVEAEKVRFPIEKIIDYCYDAMGDNFRRDLKSFDANLTEEPSKIKSERFVHLMKELSESCKIKGDYNIFTKSCYFHEDLFENLRCSSKSNEVSQDLFYYSDFMWNNLFSELMGKEEDIVDVVKIKLEVVSIHPDAGFPWYRLNARTTKFDERRF